MRFKDKRELMSDEEIDRALTRLATEIVERNGGASGLALIGIHRRGVPLAERLSAKIEQIDQQEKVKVPLASLEVTLYRDDLTTIAAQPVVKTQAIGIEVTGWNVILIDDVLYTGRTVRASMNALFQFGRPARVQLCVLVDRGWRELPVEAGYVGRTVQTTAGEIVEVRLQEVDGVEQVMLVERLND